MIEQLENKEEKMEDTMEKTQHQQKTSLLNRLQKGVKIGIVGAKLGLATVAGGTAVHIYNQFHKSPEKIHEETKQNMIETKTAVEESIQKDLGTNSIAKTVSKVGGKIAETGTAHGGAIRAWISKKLQKEN